MDSFLLIKLAYEEEVGDFEKQAIPGWGAAKALGSWVAKRFGRANAAKAAPTLGAESAEVFGRGTQVAERAAERAGTQVAKETGEAVARTVPKVEGAPKPPSFFQNVMSVTGLGDAAKGTWGHTLGAPLRPLFGPEGAGNVVGFGIMGGGLNAAMAEPGERLKAFGQGFGAGLAGGAGWQWGGSLGKGIIGRLAKPGAQGFRGTMAKVTDPTAGLNTYGKILERGTGQIPQLLGAKTLTGGIGLGSALGGSILLQNAAETHIPFLNPEGPVPPGAQAAAREVGQAMRIPAMGLTAPQMGYMNQPGANPYGTF